MHCEMHTVSFLFFFSDGETEVRKGLESLPGVPKAPKPVPLVTF